MKSLTLRIEGEDDVEAAQGTPAGRAVAGVLEDGRSPGGSVYLHPSRFLPGAVGRRQSCPTTSHNRRAGICFRQPCKRETRPPA
ncbi:uncharacterized protein B0H18DRAFT_988516, partial [Fomitopsis serialis]|uniref:uncharacterized protein n=1 Tax=Fomitopsis serialis TaxID=139415 RepID=UPI0020078DA4